MYNHIWKKYLPFINIQLKRSAGGDQVLNLNRIDFERAGTARKAGYKFTIEFIQGRIGNTISNSALASNLAAVMLENESTKEILRHGHYTVSLNTKFQLITINCGVSQKSADERRSETKEEITDSEKSES